MSLPCSGALGKPNKPSNTANGQRPSALEQEALELHSQWETCETAFISSFCPAQLLSTHGIDRWTLSTTFLMSAQLCAHLPQSRAGNETTLRKCSKPSSRFMVGCEPGVFGGTRKPNSLSSQCCPEFRNGQQLQERVRGSILQTNERMLVIGNVPRQRHRIFGDNCATLSSLQKISDRALGESLSSKELLC